MHSGAMGHRRLGPRGRLVDDGPGLR